MPFKITRWGFFICSMCFSEIGDGREKPDDIDKNVTAVAATEVVDVLLCSTFCQSQFNLSQQLAQIHPELTMPMFSGMAVSVFHLLS